jgi:exonuclease SbcC
MGSNITINMEGYRLLSGGKKLKEEITTLVYKDGFEKGSYGKFSAGERGRIEISCILAMQNLINLNSSTGGLDLLICDEILDSLDVLGLESIMTSLENIESTVMIVSQNSINSLKEDTILVQKLNGESKIIQI